MKLSVAFIVSLALPIAILLGPHLSTASNPKTTTASIVHRDLTSLRSTPTEPRYLYVTLLLRKGTLATDTDIVESLQQLHWFNRVILVVPSWQEVPDAENHPLVQQAITNLKAKRIPYVWGRRLWVAWATKDNPSTVGSEYAWQFYAAAITNINSEALAIGAVGSFFDAEPYGKSPQMTTLKRRLLTDRQRLRIRAAIRLATRRAGYVDTIYPVSSSDTSGHFAWSLAELGVLRFDAKTYWSKAPNYKLPRIDPPFDVNHRIDAWGSIIGVTQPVTGMTLTPKDVMALDLSVIRKQHPNCKAFWVFVPRKKLAEVIRSWPQ